MSNKFGLILPEKSKSQPPKFQASRNVFGNESDSEEEKPLRKLSLLRPSDNVNRQAKITQEKAVTEDPTVYQYDEIYDEMVGSKEKEKKKSKEDAKPRYIEKLMKSANKRKIENERRMERQIQKEREKEGDEFKDKEVFVTSAYKKKLEELQQEEEREKREEYLEGIGDVTKQTDLGGFYRHIYEQKLGSNKTTASDVSSTDSKNNKNISEINTEPVNTIQSETVNNMQSEPVDILKSEPIKKRNYRKRSTDIKSKLSEGEIEDSDEEINRLNLANIKLAKKNKSAGENIDADSDFSIDESSDEDTKKETAKQHSEVKELTIKKESNTLNNSISPEIEVKPEPKANKESPAETVTEVKPKIDIWKKRTVGEVFDQALRRYYERKATRGL